jgi:hypothetical protein
VRTIRSAIAELVGLFIDDGQLALTLAVLIALVTLSVKLAWIGPSSGGFLLLAGCICLLLESLYRHASRR